LALRNIIWIGVQRPTVTKVVQNDTAFCLQVKEYLYGLHRILATRFWINCLAVSLSPHTILL
jgi:hypothetical protein